MEEVRLRRASLLLEQNRYGEAEKELKEALSSNPENDEAWALPAICLSAQDRNEEALELIKRALQFSADNPRYLYFLSNILLSLEDYKEAESVIKNAINIYPLDGDFYAILSQIQLLNKEWQKALETSERGLAVDADNLSCLNARSTALIKLDRKEEAYQTIKEALNKDPENSYTHTNLGYGLLEKGDHKQALEHFRKALQLDPNSDFAKAGLVQGLKARYLVYRLFLKYAFWIGNMKGNMQVFVILGFYFGSKLLRGLASTYPVVSPFIMPIYILYIMFAFSTWIISPLSNLFLRFNVYGKYALTKDEINASNFVGICLATGLLSGLGYLVTAIPVTATLAIIALSFMIPVSATFSTEGKKRYILFLSLSLLLLAGVGALYSSLVLNEIVTGLLSIYLIGILITQMMVNFILFRR